VLTTKLTAEIPYHQGSQKDGYRGYWTMQDARPYGENRFVQLLIDPLSAAESQTLWGKADVMYQYVLCTEQSQQGRTELECYLCQMEPDQENQSATEGFLKQKIINYTII